MIEVCCAIILKKSKILAVQRGPKSSHPFEWEFPGGKLNPGETAEQCIIREIQEELTIRIGIQSKFEPIEFNYRVKQIRLIPFVCKITSGEITLTEHIAQRWFDLEEWETMKWSDADHELIIKNQESLKKLLKKTIEPDAEK
jgi:8-oxo-dGTP diphosphatase